MKRAFCHLRMQCFVLCLGLPQWDGWDLFFSHCFHSKLIATGNRPPPPPCPTRCPIFPHPHPPSSPIFHPSFLSPSILPPIASLFTPSILLCLRLLIFPPRSVASVSTPAVASPGIPGQPPIIVNPSILLSLVIDCLLVDTLQYLHPPIHSRSPHPPSLVFFHLSFRPRFVSEPLLIGVSSGSDSFPSICTCRNPYISSGIILVWVCRLRLFSNYC